MISSLKRIVLLLVSAMLAMSAWYFVDHVLVAFQIRDAASNSRPRGNLSDLYPRWLGARELLLRGRDPYSAAITREIQQGYYGRVLDPSRPNDPKDQAAFAYPVYVVFLIAPTVGMPFAKVQALFVVALCVLTMATVLLWLRVIQWKVHPLLALSFMTLIAGSLPFIQAVKLQQLTLVVGALLSGSFAAVVSGYLVSAGILLALATIKPQLTLLPVVFLTVWSWVRWRERWRLIVGFGITMIVLLSGSEIILPGWVKSFVVAMRDYRSYTHNVSLLQYFSTDTIGSMAGAVFLVVTGWLCWPIFSNELRTLKFGNTIALLLALIVVTVPMFALYNQILLVPALLLLGRDWRIVAQQKIGRILLLTTTLSLVWPWLTSLSLDVSLLFLPSTTVQEYWKLPFLSSFTLPLFVFATLAYHISRNVNPKRTLFP